MDALPFAGVDARVYRGLRITLWVFAPLPRSGNVPTAERGAKRVLCKVAPASNDLLPDDKRQSNGHNTRG